MCVYRCSAILLMLVCTLNKYSAGSLSSDLSRTQHLDGYYLLEMGQKFNNPLLKLIGKVVLNGEKNTTERLCALHPCTEWGVWSDCPVVRGFNMVTRTRVCNRTTAMCKFDSQSEFTSTESKVCEGTCPSGYNDTNGYCLKLSQNKLIQPEAEAFCQLDGGHIVNINTKNISDIIDTFLQSHGYSSTIWINGNRTSTGSSWVYTYGSAPDFDNWNNTEPSNATTELCKVTEGAPKDLQKIIMDTKDTLELTRDGNTWNFVTYSGKEKVNTVSLTVGTYGEYKTPTGISTKVIIKSVGEKIIEEHLAGETKIDIVREIVNGQMCMNLTVNGVTGQMFYTKIKT